MKFKQYTIPQRGKLSSLSLFVYKKVPSIFFIIGIVILVYSALISTYSSGAVFLSVFFTPILTLLFLIVIENWNSMKREKIMFNALIGEITYNIPILKTNLHYLTERGNLNDDEITWNPIYSVKLDVWNSISQNITIESLKINYPEFYTFVYDSRRFNETLHQRNLIPLSKDYKGAIVEYNNLLHELGTFALEHLLNVLESRGKLVKIDVDEVNDYTNLISELIDNGIESPESISGNFKEDIKYCRSDKEWEIFIFQYRE